MLAKIDAAKRMSCRPRPIKQREPRQEMNATLRGDTATKKRHGWPNARRMSKHPPGEKKNAKKAVDNAKKTVHNAIKNCRQLTGLEL